MNPATFGEVLEQIDSNKVEVLMLDPWRRVFAGDDENSAVQVSRYLDLIDQLREQSQCLVDVFMPCHTGKNHERFRESARGSSAIENWYDNLWVFRKEQASDGLMSRHFRLGIGRDSDQDDLMAYRLVKKDAFGRLRLETPGVAVLGPDEIKLLDYVGLNVGCSKTSAISASGFDQKRGLKIITTLLAAGHLTITKGAGRGHPDQLWPV